MSRVDWIAREILPFEAAARHWLCRARVDAAQRDDIIQEAYCRLASLRTVAGIQSGRLYLLATVRSISYEQARRARIVSFEQLAEIEALNVYDEGPSPERAVTARLEFARVRKLLNELPARCREIFLLRKVEGLSQREISARLGVSENVVEKQVARGMRLIARARAEDTTGWGAAEPSESDDLARQSHR